MSRQDLNRLVIAMLALMFLSSELRKSGYEIPAALIFYTVGTFALVRGVSSIGKKDEDPWFYTKTTVAILIVVGMIGYHIVYFM